MSNAADAPSRGPPPETSTPTVLPDQSTWDKVPIVPSLSSEDGTLWMGPQAPGPRWVDRNDVVKRGYMGKVERHHRRYFVLRAGSPHRAARLEWYVTAESFKAIEESYGAAGEEALCGCSKRRMIYLCCCLGVSKVSSTRKGHTLVLHAKDDTLVMVADDTGQQEEWYWAVKRVIEEEEEEEKRCKDQTEERSEGDDLGGEHLDEEDDGYCTLTAGVFKEVWLVTVKPRGLGCTKSLAGPMRLCLSANSLVLVRGSGGRLQLPGVTLALMSVRRFGHQEGMFFLELGRSAPHGPGEVWMEAQDQGDSNLAQQVHEAIRDAVRALRVLPDFRHSPVGAEAQQNGPRPLPCDQSIPARSRDKAGREVTLATLPSSLASAPAETFHPEQGPGRSARDAESPGGISVNGSSPGTRSPTSAIAPRTSGYMEMAVKGVSMATVSGGSYMMMSPQASCHEPRGEDYVAMASPPPLLPWPDLSTCMLTAQANRRSSSENHQSYPPTFSAGRRDWFFPVFRRNAPPDSSQVELLSSSCHVSQEEDEPTCGPSSRPVQTGLGRYSLRRYVMSSCLPSCLRRDEDQ